MAIASPPVPPGPPAAPTPPERDRNWRFDRRGMPWFGHAIAGGGGALVAAGVIAIGIDLYPEGGDDPGWWGAVLALVLVVLGYLATSHRVPAQLHAAGVATVAIAIPAAAAFLFLPGIDAVDDLRGFFALAIVGWVVAFAVGSTRGRPLLLALALFTALSWAQIEIGSPATAVLPAPFNPLLSLSAAVSSDSDSGTSTSETVPGSLVDPDFEDPSFDDPSFDEEFEPEFDNEFQESLFEEPNFGEVGAATGAFALVYLLAVAALDTRGKRGLATAFVIPGVLALVNAVSYLSFEAESVYVAGGLSVFAGLFCGTVGTRGTRRFTVWAGALFATVGAVLFAGQVTDSTVGDDGDNGPLTFGLVGILFGAAMILVALLVARLLREPPGDDDAIGEPDTPPVPPTPPAEPMPSGTPQPAGAWDPTAPAPEAPAEPVEPPAPFPPAVDTAPSLPPDDSTHWRPSA